MSVVFVFSASFIYLRTTNEGAWSFIKYIINNILLMLVILSVNYELFYLRGCIYVILRG